MESKTESALATTSQSSGDLQAGASAAAAQHEIQSAITVAKRFPRDEDVVNTKMLKACTRPSLAEAAEYEFPRGGKPITGPSVVLARELARLWTNVRYGLEIIGETDTHFHIRGWAWDLENNLKTAHEDTFRKAVIRKQAGKPYYKDISTDERELRELINRRGAFCVRNALLEMLPDHFVDDAMTTAQDALRKQASEDPDAARRKLLVAFDGIGVQKKDIQVMLGHPVEQITAKEISDLRTIYNSIKQGNSSWQEHMASKKPKVEQPQSKSKGKKPGSPPKLDTVEIAVSEVEATEHDGKKAYTILDAGGSIFLTYSEAVRNVCVEAAKTGEMVKLLTKENGGQVEAMAVDDE